MTKTAALTTTKSFPFCTSSDISSLRPYEHLNVLRANLSTIVNNGKAHDGKFLSSSDRQIIDNFIAWTFRKLHVLMMEDVDMSHDEAASIILAELSDALV